MRDVVTPVSHRHGVVVTVVLSENITVNHNHYSHSVAVTMAMQRIALAGGVEFKLQPRLIATPSSLPVGYHVCLYCMSLLATPGGRRMRGDLTYTESGGGRREVLRNMDGCLRTSDLDSCAHHIA